MLLWVTAVAIRGHCLLGFEPQTKSQEALHEAAPKQFNTHIARLSLIVSSTVAGAKLPFGNCRMSPAFTTFSRVA